MVKKLGGSKPKPKVKSMDADDHRKLAEMHHAKARLHSAKADLADAQNPPKGKSTKSVGLY